MPAKSPIVKNLYFADDRTEQWSFAQPGTAGGAVVLAIEEVVRLTELTNTV